MSWLVASFAIVFAALLIGWLAYERSRPSARMAAVVGTLAAVAALGRDAFVAVPDVKPITAIALVVGYALGPLPGFTVGAVGMLASNVMLGQGSYTPWQMAAWGLVGLIGAGLGLATRHRANRIAIALACALSAALAKEIMNLYTFTLTGIHTLASFLAVVGAALPFDITDVLASFAFGLAFGPELARLLARVRSRMTVQWQPSESVPGRSPATPPADPPNSPRSVPGAIAPLALIAICLIAAIPARAAAPPEVTYLERAQNSNGGFGGAPGQRGSELYSAWAAIGLAAAGRNPARVERSGHSVLYALRQEASTLAGAGDIERTILALHACGVPASYFPGPSLLLRLRRERSRNGSFGNLVNITSFAIFALRVAGTTSDNARVNAAGHWLAAQQNRDGGFGYAGRGGVEDVDDTAAALQAAIDAGASRSGAVVSRGVTYLHRAQNSDGGFPQQPGAQSDAQSTAWAIQALDAAGQNVSAFKRGRSRSPLGYLESLISSNGSVRYSRSSSQTPVWVTSQALTALAGKPLPISPV
ncbi:MAG: prenyltransferase/squalene oxidase repeat-containing protein [Solirubrobacteraceae bacterium]